MRGTVSVFRVPTDAELPAETGQVVLNNVHLGTRRPWDTAQRNPVPPLGLGHPWLVVEDAHVNVLGVLRHLHQQMRSGDYLIVEDSAIKGEALVRFLAETRDAYRLDTHYADFFGRNATAARDSIFRRA